MDQTLLDNFVLEIQTLVEAAAPGTPQADKLWQFKEVVKALSRSFANAEGVPLRTVIDGLAIAAGEYSAKLNIARAAVEREIVAKYQSEVDAALATKVID